MNKYTYLSEYFFPLSRRTYSFLNILLFFVVISIFNIKTLSANSFESDSELNSELQQGAVSGIVTDAATGETMPGVNVQIVGTNIGTVTGLDGKFSLTSVSKNTTLRFSFVGYATQDVPVQGRSVIDVALAIDALDMSEVVVIGYGSVPKESLTGAISSIQTDKILTTKTTSVATMVQGKVPGLMIRKVTGEPGVFNSKISIRGFGTPLLVIDGVIRDGMSDFERLNPQDIESISVLKDASAAIYGMNSDNGVLIVTTKSGTKGKTKINYNATWTWKQPTSVNQTNTVDAYHYRLYKNEMSRNYRLPEPYSAEELEKWRLGTEPGYTDFDWYNETIRDGVGTWQHNISITGGNEDITHYTSFGFMEDKGLLRYNETNNYQKYNIRTSLTAKLAEGLTFKTKISGKYDSKMNPPQSYFWIFKQIYISDRGYGPYTLADSTHYASVPAEGINTFAKMNKDADGYVRNANYQYQFSGELNYDLPFVKGLSLSLTGAYDGNLTQSTTFRGSYSLYDYYTDKLKNKTEASITELMTHFNRTDVQAKISYNTTIKESHNISALFVNEVRKLSTKDVGGYRKYGEIFTHDIIDQASTTDQTTRGGFSEQAYVSYIGRVNYDYKSKYLVEFAFREDGSYRYAPEKRWAFFPSGSIGWRVSEEAFIKDNVPVISNFKIRVSYGQMGADVGDPFQYVPGYLLSTTAQGAVLNSNQLTLAMIPPGVINNNLTWIKTTTANLGFDLSVWDGKLGLVADIFQKNRDGLLAKRASSVPNTFGASFPDENLNSDKFRGFELEVSHRNKIGQISYGVSANVTYARQYLLHVERSPYSSTMEIWKDDKNGDGRLQGRSWGYTRDGIYTDITEYETAPLIGGALGNYYGLPGTQRVVDTNGDGIISDDDQLPNRWNKDSNPPLQYGMNISVSWKNFDFNMLLQGASLFTFPINAGDTWGYQTYPSMWTFWEDRWHLQDPNADPYDPASVWIPGKYAPLQNSWGGTTQGTGTNLYSPPCNYVRIKNLEIGYTVPETLIRNVFLKNLRLAVNIVNLYTFSNKELKKFDPEVEAGEYNAGLTYPLMREFNFILSVNF
jgi:TonB-linked SusC/RagA family outer membrane protein